MKSFFMWEGPPNLRLQKYDLYNPNISKRINHDSYSRGCDNCRYNYKYYICIKYNWDISCDPRMHTMYGFSSMIEYEGRPICDNHEFKDEKCQSWIKKIKFWK